MKAGPTALAAFLLLCPTAAPAESEAELRERAARIHHDAILVDGHNDVPTFILDYGYDLGMDGSDPAKRDATLYWIPLLRRLLPKPAGDELRMDTDLRRLRLGGVDAQFMSIFAHPRTLPDGATQRALDMIQALKEQVARHPDELALAESSADVRRIVAGGGIAILMGLEGGHAIQNDLANLRTFHAQGVRYMTLSWANTNDWADSSSDEARHGGLTAFGREVVREMNRIGMIVDVSHVSDETFYDALEVSRAPVMASHSCARALADHPRNLSDGMLRAVRDNGGVVMVNFVENYLDPDKTGFWPATRHVVSNLGWVDTPFERVVDHIEHVIAIAGIDHVGLGSDFDGTVFLPAGLKDVADFPNITRELVRRGHGEQEIRKILGENALRVLSQAKGRP